MRWFSGLLRLIPGIVMTGLTIWAILFFTFAPTLPDTSKLWHESAAPAIFILDHQERLIETRGGAGRRPVRLSELPDYLGKAVIAIEDRRFYDHFGFDVIGFGRAVAANIAQGRIVQGGSTITQQLAKNLFLKPERSLKRKIEELVLAIWLETRLDKDEILALYLNRVYFGAGAYGVEAAARRYFNKSSRALTLPEAAMLAGLLTAPSILAPTNNLDRAQKRAALVLTLMTDAGFIDRRQAETARAQPARLASRIANETGYFVDLVLSRVEDRFGRPSKDLAVRTTLDLDSQRLAEHAVNTVFERELVKDSPLEAALVIIDQRGAMIAMLGGRFYGRSSYNRAIRANRQTGSAFKPFVYLAGLEAGMTPVTLVADAPITIDGWSPRNAGGRYWGKVALEDALARSLNVATVRISEAVGRDKVIAAVDRLGVGREIASLPSLALGATQMSALELARAYAAFAFGGNLPTAYLLNALRHGEEAPVIMRPPAPVNALSADHAEQMTRMLKKAVEAGSGQAAQAAGCGAAGKTGTTQHAVDAWFIGYCKGYVGAVWVGFDDNRPMRGVTGGGLPAKIWAEIFRRLPPSKPSAKSMPEPGLLADAQQNEGVGWFLEQLQAVIDEFSAGR